MGQKFSEDIGQLAGFKGIGEKGFNSWHFFDDGSAVYFKYPCFRFITLFNGCIFIRCDRPYARNNASSRLNSGDTTY